MHTLGKVLAFLVIVAAAASTYFTATLIKVRNSWTAKSQNFDKSYDATVADLAKTNAEFVKLRDEIQFARRQWGGTFEVQTQLTDPPESGRLQIDAGSNVGLSQQMVIHGFQILPDQSTIYRGPFVVTSVQTDRSLVAPTWRIRAQDLQAIGDAPPWQSSMWRWRTAIPSAHSVRFDQHLQAFTAADETIAERQQSLTVQQRLVAEAERQLQLRTAELVGGPELPQDAALNPEDREGLVGPLEAEEEQRNKDLLEIARLRQQVRTEKGLVERLQRENEELTTQLPQPAAAITRAQPN